MSLAFFTRRAVDWCALAFAVGLVVEAVPTVYTVDVPGSIPARQS